MSPRFMISLLGLFLTAFCRGQCEAQAQNIPKEVVIFATGSDGHPPLARSNMTSICSDITESFSCKLIFLSGASGSFTPATQNLTVFQFIQKLDAISGKGYTWTVVGDKTLGLRDRGARSTLVADASSGSTFAYERDFDPFSDDNTACSSLSPCPFGRSVIKVQRNAPSHLSALVRESDPSQSTVRFSEMGSGVTVFVVDGQVARNDEFNELTSPRTRISKLSFISPTAKDTQMFACSGEHGTHVASLVTGLSYGPAKNATVVSAAVQPGCGSSGLISDLAAGLSWVLDQLDALKGAPAVVTMSLQLSKSDPSSIIIESLVREMLGLGAIVVAASGNYASDACAFSPAGIDGVITVGALDGNIPWSDSNYGECVDVWAPGVSITGASPDCFRCTATFTGTSQAAPLVAGLVAMQLEVDPTTSPDDMKKWLIENAVTLDDVGADATYKSARFQRNWFQ